MWEPIPSATLALPRGGSAGGSRMATPQTRSAVRHRLAFCLLAALASLGCDDDPPKPALAPRPVAAIAPPHVDPPAAPEVVDAGLPDAGFDEALEQLSARAPAEMRLALPAAWGAARVGDAEVFGIGVAKVAGAPVPVRVRLEVVQVQAPSVWVAMT